MEESNTPEITIRGTGIRYGAILGLISIAYFMVLVLTGVNTADGLVRWSVLIFSTALVILGQMYYKQSGNGYMSYSQGLSLAFWVSLISSVISSAFTVLYLTVIDPDFAQMMQDMQMQAMEEQGLSEEQIEQGMKIAAKFTTPPMLFLFGVIGGIFTTMMVALVTTFFTKKENPNMPE
ncbi:MAG: DUF4199 domain-containing protein [Cyclobacteriaceae bacterium]